MGYRTKVMGRGLARHGDKTSTGATCIGSLPNVNEHELSVVRVGDKTTPCKICGKAGTVIDGIENVTFHGAAAAVDRSNVQCGCQPGTNYIIAPAGEWLGSDASPEQEVAEKYAAMLAGGRDWNESRRQQEVVGDRVFAKSCLRGVGCTDAGDQREPHTNFADMAFYQVIPTSEPATDSGTPQHAQTARKKPGADQQRTNYQTAVAAITAVARAQTVAEGESALELIAGRALTYGTWAVRGVAGLGEVAAAGAGASVAGLLVGMYPGRTNDGEQDFIDRMRLEQMREAPSRVRYTWENDSRGNPVPHGWHTPPGRDSVRVRKMEYDSSAQAYTFTTEEEPRITIVWTPDRTGEEKPWNTGNQVRPVLPNPVVVDPLPDNTGITATTSPVPEEKSFADYILILPFPDLPPIYIYLSKPPVEFLEVELYSDFKRRSRQGKYEADHMPSAAAVKTYLRREYPHLKETEIQELSLQVAAIVVPKDVHQKISETYGGRNTAAQIELDSQNLRAAANRNLDALKPELKKHGATEAQIEKARTKMHTLNSQQGLYK